MEADHGSMAVTVSFAALTCAGETLATMFLSALVKTHLLALYLLYFAAVFSVWLQISAKMRRCRPFLWIPNRFSLG
ncbi:hypothetical protein QQP08_002925 [Theobroma cacao]|nr:hypothetical protein QQP08_002925 [Theobroma cacao]